tara:strand:- start:1 stop:390 length:390 start_codon:yes stop_codon:yes gene_type:complete
MLYASFVDEIVRSWNPRPEWYRFETTWESIEVPEGYEKPPKEEFEAKFQELIDAQPLIELRVQRNRLLKQTDFLTVPDFPYPSENIRTAWLAYRQKLRNITATETPSLDEKYQLVVTWPTPPIWPANVV